jgi:hypothetical protein
MRIAQFAARPFGHAAKKFRMARFDYIVLNSGGPAGALVVRDDGDSTVSEAKPVSEVFRRAGFFRRSSVNNKALVAAQLNPRQSRWAPLGSLLAR